MTNEPPSDSWRYVDPVFEDDEPGPPTVAALVVIISAVMVIGFVVALVMAAT